MSKLTSRAQVEEALHGLRGRPRSIIIQCPASQAPLLRGIVLGLEGFELHPFDIATLRPYQRDEIARAIYNRMFRSDTTPIVYLSTEPVRFGPPPSPVLGPPDQPYVVCFLAAVARIFRP